MPVSFDDFAQLDRPALFHRLPDGVGGFVEEDFVGHGVRSRRRSRLRRLASSNGPEGAEACSRGREPLETWPQFTIEAPEGRHRSASMTNDVAPAGLLNQWRTMTGGSRRPATRCRRFAAEIVRIAHATATSGRGFMRRSRRRLRHRRFGLVDDRVERGRVGDGQLGERSCGRARCWP